MHKSKPIKSINKANINASTTKSSSTKSKRTKAHQKRSKPSPLTPHSRQLKTKSHIQPQTTILPIRASSKNLSRQFSTQTTVSPQTTYQFPQYSTSQSPMLSHFPENATFHRDFTLQNYPSATQALNRMDLVFQSMPMPALQFEVGLKKIKLALAQGQIFNAIQEQEKILSTLSTSLKYHQNTRITLVEGLTSQTQPFITGPVFNGKVIKKKQSQNNNNNTDETPSQDSPDLIPLTPIGGLNIGFNQSAIDTTYGPLLSSLVLNYIKVGQFSKIPSKISKFLNIPLETIIDESTGLIDISKLETCRGDLSPEMIIMIAGIQGYALEQQLTNSIKIDSHKLKIAQDRILNGDGQHSDTAHIEPSKAAVQKPKFVLKTLKTTTTTPATESATTTGAAAADQSHTPTQHKHNHETTDDIETSAEIIARKEACQKEQLQAQETKDLTTPAPTTSSSTADSVQKAVLNTKYPSVSPKFQSLLTTLRKMKSHTELDISEFLSTNLLNELDTLPIAPIAPITLSDGTATTTTLSKEFSKVFGQYIKVLHKAIHLDSSEDSSSDTDPSQSQILTPTTLPHIIDSLTHISSLFTTLVPIYQQMEAHKAKTTPALSQYQTVFTSLHSTLFHDSLIDHTGLTSARGKQPGVADSAVTTTTTTTTTIGNNTKLYPYHITIPTGPRLVTSQLAIDSGSLPYLNTTLKSAEKLLGLGDKDLMMKTLFKDTDVNENLTENFQYHQQQSQNFMKIIHDSDEEIAKFQPTFTNFGQNKANILSPLLLAIGMEYLSLNPINTEGLARTAVSYLEKSNTHSYSTKQQLVDSYLSHAYILSNLSWNGKLRTAEAIGLVVKAKDVIDKYNQINNVISPHLTTTTSPPSIISSIPLAPRNLAFNIKHKFKTSDMTSSPLQNDGKNHDNNDNNNVFQTDIDWNDVTKHGQDYDITIYPN